MKKPTQMEAFDVLYTIAAGGGRAEALFGNSIAQARNGYERTLIGDGYPTAYIEFPLLGDPCFDLLSVYDSIEPGSRFAPGAGFGYQTMFDWYASAWVPNKGIGCGIELDTSAGEMEQAGAYLQQRGHNELVGPFLESVGAADRAASYLDVCARMPLTWKAEYAGLFPGRKDAPMRIGGYLGRKELLKCSQDPAHLGRQLRQVGFCAFDAPMLGLCADLMALAPAADFQFDVAKDGSLTDVFGLSVSFNKTKPREAKVCMESGYGSRLMERLEGLGLADGRWRLIGDAPCARYVGFERDDGSWGRFAFIIRLNFAKVKFKGTEPQAAKFYLDLTAGELMA